MPYPPPTTVRADRGNGGIPESLDSTPSTTRQRESQTLAIRAVEGRIRECQASAKLGVVESLSRDQGTRRCLELAMTLAERDIDHEDARTRHKAGVLALRAVELAEIFLRDGPAASAPKTQGGDTYNVVQIDATRAQALERLRRLTGGAA